MQKRRGPQSGPASGSCVVGPWYAERAALGGPSALQPGGSGQCAQQMGTRGLLGLTCLPLPHYQLNILSADIFSVCFRLTDKVIFRCSWGIWFSKPTFQCIYLLALFIQPMLLLTPG